MLPAAMTARGEPVWALAAYLPRQGDWSEEAYLAFHGEHSRIELVVKRRAYAAAGVPEYWIVDPEAETVTVLRLDGDAYAEHGVFARGATATSARYAGLSVDVDAVFDAD